MSRSDLSLTSNFAVAGSVTSTFPFSVENAIGDFVSTVLKFAFSKPFTVLATAEPETLVSRISLVDVRDFHFAFYIFNQNIVVVHRSYVQREFHRDFDIEFHLRIEQFRADIHYIVFFGGGNIQCAVF